MGGGGMGRPGGPGTGAEIRWFHAADRDGDGKVTLDEFVDFQKEIFKRLDRNDDGVLTPDEFQRADLAPQGDVPPMGWGRLDGPGPMPASIHPEALVQRLVAQRDRDGNGALSLEEFGADRKALFEALDRNNDGVVTVQDIITAIRDNPRALRLLGGLTVSGDGPHGPAGMGPGMGMGLGPGGQAGPGGQRRMETPESVGSANQDQTDRDTQRPRQQLTDPQ